MSNPNIYYEGREVKFKIKKIGKVIFPKRAIKAGDFAILSVYPLDNEDGQIYVHPTWGNCTIKGKVPQLVDGEEYEIIATEVPQDPKYGQGWQYNIIKMSSPSSKQLKDNAEGRTFLKAIFTDNQYTMLTSIDNPIELLERGDSTELSKIKGIGKTTANKMISKYNSLKECSGDVLAFAKLDMTDNEVKTIMEYYNDNSTIAIQSIKDNPYCLTDIKGFGFKKVDDIALRNGLVGEHDKRRVKAYIEYLFYDMSNNQGHVWTWTDSVFDCVCSELELEDEEIIAESLRELVNEQVLWTSKEHDKLALKRYRDMEKNIAKELIRLKNGKSNLTYDGWEDRISKIEKSQGWKFADEQIEGIRAIHENNVVIITGVPGSGKTASLLGAIQSFNNESINIKQTALAGKCASNLADVTGEEGYTIHRLLGFNPESGFAYNRDNQLNCDLVILDETSMVGGELFYSLIQAIKTGTKLVLLGDRNQLESIGVANILKDMIDSEVIKTVKLEKIHRQGKKSAIKTVCSRILNKEQLVDKGQEIDEVWGELKDLRVFVTNDRYEIADRALDKYYELYQSGVPKEDIVILSPMQEGSPTRCLELNKEIQYIVHKDLDKMKGYVINKGQKNEYSLYVGDRVINRKNNYKAVSETDYINKNVDIKGNYVATPIFNGDVGTVVKIEEDKVFIDFDLRGVIVVFKDHIYNIKLGYSFTTHSAQGLSIPYVIGCIDSSHYIMLCREQLYTMISRASKYMCLCAENRALRTCINTSNVNKKNTFLRNDLKTLDK